MHKLKNLLAMPQNSPIEEQCGALTYYKVLAVTMKSHSALYM